MTEQDDREKKEEKEKQEEEVGAKAQVTEADNIAETAGDSAENTTENMVEESFEESFAKEKAEGEKAEEKKNEKKERDDEKRLETQKYDWPAVTNNKVLVGMTGGVDSTVAAFLLKKQGYECIGVAIIFIDERQMGSVIETTADEHGYFARKANLQRITHEQKLAFLNDHCSVKNVEVVAQICQKLGIPFYVVNAMAEYKGLITDRMVGAALTGEYFPTCVYENNLKMDILNERAKKLGCSYVATGHYAKLLRHQGSSVVDICVSNDTENDQSYLLSALQDQQVERLLMPLADIRRQEVLRINERFNLGAKIRRDSHKMCFVGRGDISYYIDSVVPENLKMNGGIIHRTQKIQIAEHSGLHKFVPGQKLVNSRGLNIFQLSMDESLVVHEISNFGKIWVLPEEQNTSTTLGLVELHLRSGLDISKPLSVYFQNDVAQTKRARGMIFFKNNRMAVVIMDDPLKMPGRGQILTFYSKEGVGAKILGCGRIDYMGDLTLLNRIEHLEGREEVVDDNDDRAREIKAKREMRRNTVVSF